MFWGIVNLVHFFVLNAFSPGTPYPLNDQVCLISLSAWQWLSGATYERPGTMYLALFFEVHIETTPQN